MDVIVVDGGGTSTKFALFHNGKRIREEKLPSCHLMQVGEEKMTEILKDGISKLKGENTPILIFGLAGYGNDLKLKESIERIIKENFASYPYYLTNDIELAYYSELEKRCGILLILGTGSIAYKFKNDKFIRSGGWGYFIGDEASGYYLGKKLLREFTYQSDDREKKTLLYDKVKSHFAIENDFDLISISKDMSRTEVAALSRIVIDLYKNNDIPAKKIIEEMVNECVKMIKSLLDQEVKEVVLFGGLTQAGIGLDKLISKKLKNNVEVRIASKDALEGGYKLALEKFDLE